MRGLATLFWANFGMGFGKFREDFARRSRVKWIIEFQSKANSHFRTQFGNNDIENDIENEK